MALINSKFRFRNKEKGVVRPLFASTNFQYCLTRKLTVTDSSDNSKIIKYINDSLHDCVALKSSKLCFDENARVPWYLACPLFAPPLAVQPSQPP